jgi:transposase
VGKTKRGKGTRIMAITDAGGVVLAVPAQSASPHEGTLAEKTLEDRFADELPQKLIGDRAYDSDPLDEQLDALGVQMIAPHRNNRTRNKTQDGRKLGRYKRRWKTERFFAWLYDYRRCVVRYEYKENNFKTIVRVASMMIFLKSYFHL